MTPIILQHGILELFLFLKLLLSATKGLDSYANLYNSNYFENNTVNDTNESWNDDDNVTTNAFSVVDVFPTEMVVDESTELQLTMDNYTGTNSTPILCFLSTPDDDLEIFPSFWISDTQIKCASFKPLVSGLFFVTAHSSNIPTNCMKKLAVRVISKHPVAKQAEYSYNLDKIYIHFDTNIELNSNCASTFSKKCLEYFGRDFRCTVIGDTLIVKMGNNFKMTTAVEIVGENKICRSGSGKEFCLPAKPGNVNITRFMVSDPTLTLLMASNCSGNLSEKYISLKLSSDKPQKNSKGETLSDHSGKNQRKNLILWRTLRKIQSKLSLNVTLKMDKSDIESLYENLGSFENLLENGNIQSESSRFGVTVSVYVHSSPTEGFILAEASVKFCPNFNQSFRYKWIVNQRTIPEDSKLLIMENATPGKYLIKIYIVAYNSSEVLGESWTTTEIFESRRKIMVYPVEVVTGMTENVTLHVAAWHDGKISWSCRTDSGKVCITNNQNLIDDILDLNSFNLSIPAGILPVGQYIWTVENSQGVNAAKVTIKPENEVAINVKMDSVLVGESQRTVLQGIVKGLQYGCRLWWSSVREKGFNYIPLQDFGDREKAVVRHGETEQKINLIFPSSLKNGTFLQPDSLYLFKLQTFCPHSASFEYVKVPVGVNNPPRVSPIRVEPGKGLAMSTNFVISEVQADDSAEDYPLLYEWSYMDACGVETPITRGIYSREVTTFLPPGDVRVSLRVCDVRRACSKMISPVIDVSHSKLIPENFQNAANQIYYSLVSGDYLEAFGLATTVFKSLALKPETEIRRSVFTSLEEGVYMRIRHFNETVDVSPAKVKSYSDFVNRALLVVKYFPKSSSMSGRLRDFKNGLLKNALEKINIK